MTFDQWWMENKQEISADCEIALTENLKSWFRQCYSGGMVRGEQYLKDKIRPGLNQVEKLIREVQKPREPVPEEVNEEEEVNQTPPQYMYRKGDEVEVFTGGSYGKWWRGIVVADLKEGDTLVRVKTVEEKENEFVENTQGYRLDAVRKIW